MVDVATALPPAKRRIGAVGILDSEAAYAVGSASDAA